MTFTKALSPHQVNFKCVPRAQFSSLRHENFLHCFEHNTQSEIYRRGNVENDWNSSVVRRSPSKAIIGSSSAFQHFRLFPMPEVSLSRCWPSSEMPGILCFKIVGIPIKACAAQLSFNVFPLTNQYWHH